MRSMSGMYSSSRPSPARHPLPDIGSPTDNRQGSSISVGAPRGEYAGSVKPGKQSCSGGCSVAVRNDGMLRAKWTASAMRV
jgi:hypothetical protein